jgi:hypothetical protein
MQLLKLLLRPRHSQLYLFACAHILQKKLSDIQQDLVIIKQCFLENHF